MLVSRFFLFWVADYILATIGVVVLSVAARTVFHLPLVSTLGIMVVIPLSTALFSYLAYRSLYTHHQLQPPDTVEARKQNMRIAAAWVFAALIVDTVIAVIGYGYPLVAFLASAEVISTLGLKFSAVVGGSYLAKRHQFGSVPQTNFLDQMSTSR